MKKLIPLLLIAVLLSLVFIYFTKSDKQAPVDITASEILSNPNYLAISYGGYREKSREIQPTIPQIKEDLMLMYAMGIRLLRTYNVHLAESANLLQAISEIKKSNPTFEMYVMLGAWIDCKNAWTDQPVDHSQESEKNEEEIARAVELAKQYPDIVKIIAVGNEAMVKWATAYYVQPEVILKWVNHLQDLKKVGKLPSSIWITSSDNFASWGGGSEEYHVEALNQLIKAVDFVSMHTYPMHDTHYNPQFWGIAEDEEHLSDQAKIDIAMEHAKDYAVSQYNSVVKYLESIKVSKPVHIGETGWATFSNEHYGDEGSQACDEYKSAKFYHLIRQWAKDKGVACFYFEAFDEQWKDAANPGGSENHFGLINLQSQAKYAIWDMVDDGTFDGLMRDGKKISKTYDGKIVELMKHVKVPPMKLQAQHQ